ncbi:MAG: DUF2145 domain-containing protein [Sphingobacteriia bacterium]|nr:DUF2145 domain-containing protein [Sphingobacteriia bacterium]
MLKTILCLFSILLPITSFAGTSCEQKAISAQEILNASNAAIGLKNFLNKHDPEVAIIARVGSNAAKYGIKFTHGAYVLKQGNSSAWKVVHLLNKCGSNKSDIYDQGLMNFYLDDLHTMETLVIIPEKNLQKSLAKVLNSSTKLVVHHPHYSTIAYPFSLKYQNSNQWLLEALTMAENQSINNRQEAQHYLKNNNYVPSKIAIGGFEQLGANLFKSSVSFDDHPKEENASGKFSVVTVDSILNYLKKNKLLIKAYALK